MHTPSLNPLMHSGCHTYDFLSSSGATTSIFEYFDPLNIWFPLITILDAANPIFYFQFLHVIFYVIVPFVLWSPLWSYWHRFPLINFFFLTILSSGIRCKWSNQLNRCVLYDLLYSYFLLIHLIHRLFWFSTYRDDDTQTHNNSQTQLFLYVGWFS